MRHPGDFLYGGRAIVYALLALTDPVRHFLALTRPSSSITRPFSQQALMRGMRSLISHVAPHVWSRLTGRSTTTSAADFTKQFQTHPSANRPNRGDMIVTIELSTIQEPDYAPGTGEHGLESHGSKTTRTSADGDTKARIHVDEQVDIEDGREDRGTEKALQALADGNAEEGGDVGYAAVAPKKVKLDLGGRQGDSGDESAPHDVDVVVETGRSSDVGRQERRAERERRRERQGRTISWDAGLFTRRRAERREQDSFWKQL